MPLIRDPAPVVESKFCQNTISSPLSDIDQKHEKLSHNKTSQSDLPHRAAISLSEVNRGGNFTSWSSMHRGDTGLTTLTSSVPHLYPSEKSLPTIDVPETNLFWQKISRWQYLSIYSTLGCILCILVARIELNLLQVRGGMNSVRNIMDDYRSSQEAPPLSSEITGKIQENNEHPSDGGSIFNRFRSDNPGDYSSTKEDQHYKLVVAGKMSINDLDCKIAQLNLITGIWNTSECVQLNLYNSFSGGVVYSLLAKLPGFRSTSKIKTRPETSFAGEVIVVGAFDTTYKNSQVTYCSVGKWNGVELSKVGEGLCNSALSKGMKLTAAAFGNSNDVYVAGSFVTQVWNGNLHKFVKIYNLAHFSSDDQVWLPLEIGQISCSWCTVTVLALAWDSKRKQLHVGGKFNGIDNRNIPAGMAIYNHDTGHLVAHPGGGVSLFNITEDGVVTALQFDDENGVLYVMGSFTRLTNNMELCAGLAAFEVEDVRWTCLANHSYSVVPSGSGNMLLTPYGLMVAGLATGDSTWERNDRPYTIALLKTIITPNSQQVEWDWLPGFPGHDLPLHILSNGFDQFKGSVFIGGDNYIARWSYVNSLSGDYESGENSRTKILPMTHDLSNGIAKGTIMAMSQLKITPKPTPVQPSDVNYTTVLYFMALGSVLGVCVAILCNKSLNSALLSFLTGESRMAAKGISLDTLTYSALENANIQDAYHHALQSRFVHHPLPLTLINPHEIYLHRIIGEGTFGRVWSAKWRSSSVAVKEFVFAQAAVAGRSSMQKQIIDEIIGEAGMMAILRHPHVLQLFGCSLTAQAIWIVSELCSLGSLRQVLDDREKELSTEVKLKIALHVAEGMTYLHTQNPPIIHRDLKSHNIFVHETVTEDHVHSDKNPPNAKKHKDFYHYQSIENGLSQLSESTIVAKIGDWGSARAALSGSKTMTHGVGTACWLAPEVIKHARASKFSDVYSFGIVLWELATREDVYEGLETTQIIARVAGDNLRPEIPEKCLWKDMMVKCWDEIPQNRMSFEKIVEELDILAKQCKKGVESEGNVKGGFKRSFQNRK